MVLVARGILATSSRIQALVQILHSTRADSQPLVHSRADHLAVADTLSPGLSRGKDDIVAPDTVRI